MSTKLLITVTIILALAISILLFPSGVAGVLIGAVCAGGGIYLIRRNGSLDKTEKRTLINLFLIGLIFRTLLAAIISGFELESIFGPDAFYYHKQGKIIAAEWWHIFFQYPLPSDTNIDLIDDRNWGMPYFVAAIYFLVGPNSFAVQIISAAFGAATAVIIYFCAFSIFQNRMVARYSGLAVAVFPALIIWSAQMLKDGFIVFLLSLTMLSILQLQRSFSYKHIIILLLGLIGIFALRFYLFPLLAVTAVGGFLIGSKTSVQNIITRGLALVVIGLVLAYAGILHQSQTQLESYGDLKVIENSRRYASSSNIAGSGFNSGANVSTVAGAVMALPEGAANLMAAPFPWQMEKVTQMMLFPEMLVWWLSLPLTFIGLWYAIKNRRRESIPILLFIVMLGFLYSIGQGNLGTLYRQRIQIQIFLFIFSAAGLVTQIEKREISRLVKIRRFQFQRAKSFYSNG